MHGLPGINFYFTFYTANRDLIVFSLTWRSSSFTFVFWFFPFNRLKSRKVEENADHKTQHRGQEIESVPGGYIPTQETKQRECWKNVPAIVRDFDSRVHGQSSNSRNRASYRQGSIS